MYKNRRKKIAESLKDNSVLILFSGTPHAKSEDENYQFDVNRNFYYFTGLENENMILVIRKDNNKITSILFIEPYDPLLAKWVGGRISKTDAMNISNVDIIKNKCDFEDYISKIFSYNRYDEDFSVFFDLWRYSYYQTTSPAIKFANELIKKYPSVKIIDAYFVITELRMYKERYEIECMEKANEITNKGLLAMMSYIKPNVYEKELEKIFELEIAKFGHNELSFPTIAASGKNATVLHYNKNTDICRDNDLFLCDLGTTKNHYCADVSRTFPVNGKFTNRQKEVYQLVLKAQKIVEQNVRPNITNSYLNSLVIEYYREELPKIGLTKDVSEYYFHGVSHMIGLDCHDVDLRPGKTILEKGMVISNEPGLYISDEGLGIRIEDDLLITDEGCINLSKNIIKEIDDIEKYMQNK